MNLNRILNRISSCSLCIRRVQASRLPGCPRLAKSWMRQWIRRVLATRALIVISQAGKSGYYALFRCESIRANTCIHACSAPSSGPIPSSWISFLSLPLISCQFPSFSLCTLTFSYADFLPHSPLTQPCRARPGQPRSAYTPAETDSEEIAEDAESQETLTFEETPSYEDEVQRTKQILFDLETMDEDEQETFLRFFYVYPIFSEGLEEHENHNHCQMLKPFRCVIYVGKHLYVQMHRYV